MPSFYYLTNVSGNGVRANMGAEIGASVFVAQAVTVVSMTDSYTNGEGADQVVSVQGSMISTANTASTIVLSGEAAQVLVGETGSVQALNTGDRAAVVLEGRNSGLSNQGSISGGAGLQIGNGAAAGQSSTSHIFNTGLIQGIGMGGAQSAAAILAHTGEGLGQQRLVLDNTGVLRGGPDLNIGSAPRAIETTGDTGVWTISNSGTIVGEVWLGYGNDELVNFSRIVGRVNLGDGGDTFRNVGDGYVTGTVLGFNGSDKMYGGDLSDDFKGGYQGDRLWGNGGDDELDGGEGADRIYGGPGDDLLIGGLSADELGGGSGDDVLEGGDKSDTLKGGRDDDLLSGGEGGDTLNGGRGDDVLTGGEGSDTFVFGRNVDEDVITDFDLSRDEIDLSLYELRNLSALKTSDAFYDTNFGAVVHFTTLGGSGQVLIEGIEVADFSGGNFIF